MPANPINAIESNPAVMRAIGVPCKEAGILVYAKRSLMPAKMTIAKVKPMALAKA